MHINERVAHYDRLCAHWSSLSRGTGGRVDPRSRALRARATALCSHLVELRKRLAAARELVATIEALVIESGADDAVEERAAQQEAA